METYQGEWWLCVLRLKLVAKLHVVMEIILKSEKQSQAWDEEINGSLAAGAVRKDSSSVFYQIKFCFK